jgi:hypothetical protein
MSGIVYNEKKRKVFVLDPKYLSIKLVWYDKIEPSTVYADADRFLGTVDMIQKYKRVHRRITVASDLNEAFELLYKLNDY